MQQPSEEDMQIASAIDMLPISHLNNFKLTTRECPENTVAIGGGKCSPVCGSDGKYSSDDRILYEVNTMHKYIFCGLGLQRYVFNSRYLINIFI